MKSFAIKKLGELVLKNGTKSVPRFYSTTGHANNAIAQLASEDRSKDRRDCYDNLKRSVWDAEMHVFCKEAVPPVEHYKENYEIVEMNF
jgi:hypothetical protein